MDIKKQHWRSKRLAFVVCAGFSLLLILLSGKLLVDVFGQHAEQMAKLETRSSIDEYRMRAAGFDLPTRNDIDFNTLKGVISVGGLGVLFIWLVWTRLHNTILFLVRKPVINVLWLRKFNSNPSQSRFWVSDVIENCYFDYFRTVTLADQQFHFSTSKLRHNDNKRILGFYSLGLLGMMLPGFAVMGFEENLYFGLAGVLAYFAWMTWMYLQTRKQLRLRRQIRKRAENPNVPPMDFQQIVTNFNEGSPKDRVFVYRTFDDSWKSIVKHFIDNVDLVLIDISNLSENMEWELRTAIDSIGLDRILFLSDRHFGSKEQLLKFVPPFAKEMLDVDEDQLHILTYSSNAYRGGSYTKSFSKHLSLFIYRLVDAAHAANGLRKSISR